MNSMEKIIDELQKHIISQTQSSKEKLTAVYHERNMCVLLAAKLAAAQGDKVGRALHDANDKAWEADWRHIVYFETQEGQLSWHIHDSELPMFSWLPLNRKYGWDGHTTPEKYERVARLFSDDICEERDE